MTSSVCGISETPKPSASNPVTVRLTPLTRDRALLDHVAQAPPPAPSNQTSTALPCGRQRDDLADAVDVALHPVAAHAVTDPQCRLEVDHGHPRPGHRAWFGRASPVRRRNAADCPRSSVTVRQQPSTATESPIGDVRADHRRGQHQARRRRLDHRLLHHDPREHPYGSLSSTSVRISGPTARDCSGGGSSHRVREHARAGGPSSTGAW